MKEIKTTVDRSSSLIKIESLGPGALTINCSELKPWAKIMITRDLKTARGLEAALGLVINGQDFAIDFCWNVAVAKYAGEVMFTVDDGSNDAER